MLAGDTTRLKLADMAKGGMLYEGDVWLYCRTFKGCLTIKKEIRVRPSYTQLMASAPKSMDSASPFHSAVLQSQRSIYVQDWNP
jgi:hypothetical protein